MNSGRETGTSRISGCRVRSAWILSRLTSKPMQYSRRKIRPKAWAMSWALKLSTRTRSPSRQMPSPKSASLVRRRASAIMASASSRGQHAELPQPGAAVLISLTQSGWAGASQMGSELIESFSRRNSARLNDRVCHDASAPQGCSLLVPTVPVGKPSLTLCVLSFRRLDDAERRGGIPMGTVGTRVVRGCVSGRCD